MLSTMAFCRLSIADSLMVAAKTATIAVIHIYSNPGHAQPITLQNSSCTLTCENTDCIISHCSERTPWFMHEQMLYLSNRNATKCCCLISGQL